MMVDKQAILKAFYKMDRANIKLTNVEGRPVNHLDVEARKELCDIWLDVFNILDTELWDKVIAVMVAECKEYPSIDEVSDIIERLRDPSKTAEPTPVSDPVPQTPPPPPNKTAAEKNNTEEQSKISAMFELAKQGKYKEAKRLVAEASMPEARIIQFAKEHWPKCTKTWIQDNWLELVHLVCSDDKCRNCFSLFNCATHGYRAYGMLDKYSGGLIIKTTICQKKLERNGE